MYAVGWAVASTYTERKSVDCEIRVHCKAVMWCGRQGPWEVAVSLTSGPQTPGQETHERDGRGALGLKA